MAFVVGLTGSFGSGKSAVAQLLREGGAEVIDADALAHQATEPGTPTLAAITAEFGPGVLDAGGRLKRRELAERVFGDRQALARLEAIVHPAVRGETERLLTAWGVRPLVVLDVPLLLEAGMQDLVDTVVVVAINERQRFLRLRRRGFSEREVIRRLGMQMPQARKIRLADQIIDNSGTIDATRKQVQTLMDQIFQGKKPKES